MIPTPLSIPSLEFFILENGPTCINVKKQDVFILLFNPSSLLNSLEVLLIQFPKYIPNPVFPFI